MGNVVWVLKAPVYHKAQSSRVNVKCRMHAQKQKGFASLFF
jgi:hypothetical protein